MARQWPQKKLKMTGESNELTTNLTLNTSSLWNDIDSTNFNVSDLDEVLESSVMKVINNKMHDLHEVELLIEILKDKLTDDDFYRELEMSQYTNPEYLEWLRNKGPIGVGGRNLLAQLQNRVSQIETEVQNELNRQGQKIESTNEAVKKAKEQMIKMRSKFQDENNARKTEVRQLQMAFTDKFGLDSLHDTDPDAPSEIKKMVEEGVFPRGQKFNEAIEHMKATRENMHTVFIRKDVFHSYFPCNEYDEQEEMKIQEKA